MGYFATLADAERWAEGIRGRYPEAFATVAPAAGLQSDSAALLPEPSDARQIPESCGPAPLTDHSLTDTQVMRVLENRGVSAGRDDVAERSLDQIALLRPEDTSTRHALKEAVVQGAPVSFAIQLHWSAQPIDLSRMPSLPIFKAHTLYATESRRDGRARYFLRLGFFADPISAKEVAAQVRSNFASAAVVPVAEHEVTRVREARTHTSAIPYIVQQSADRAPDTNGTPGSAPEPKPSSDVPRWVSKGPETLEQTLRRLARREMLTDPDSVNESGVRHLRIEVQEQPHRPGSFASK